MTSAHIIPYRTRPKTILVDSDELSIQPLLSPLTLRSANVHLIHFQGQTAKRTRMTRSRLENDLSADQLRWLSTGLFVLIIPAAYMMYRHYQSLKARYPPSEAGGKSKIKTT